MSELHDATLTKEKENFEKQRSSFDKRIRELMATIEAKESDHIKVSTRIDLVMDIEILSINNLPFIFFTRLSTSWRISTNINLQVSLCLAFPSISLLRSVLFIVSHSNVCSALHLVDQLERYDLLSEKMQLLKQKCEALLEAEKTAFEKQINDLKVC
ncbi:hypothetical protein EON64_08330 [archaeon]|nr:MAG: hypothetical protein EON64_08330 [archaeon]